MVKDRKTKLQPAIKDLRTVRQDFGELESVYLRDKAVYDNTAAGLETERAVLERQADALQEDALREESRYHQLQLLMDTTQAALTRAKEESECEKPEGRFLRDFKTRKDLYQQKLTQLETLAKELRKKQKDIKENSSLHAAQRSRFLDLKRLLAEKQAVYRADPSGGFGAAAGGVDALLGGASGNRGFEDTGGANVMTLGE
jgi:intraflagellar transport protein 81